MTDGEVRPTQCAELSLRQLLLAFLRYVLCHLLCYGRRFRADVFHAVHMFLEILSECLHGTENPRLRKTRRVGRIKHRLLGFLFTLRRTEVRARRNFGATKVAFIFDICGLHLDRNVFAASNGTQALKRVTYRDAFFAWLIMLIQLSLRFRHVSPPSLVVGTQPGLLIRLSRTAFAIPYFCNRMNF